MIEDCKIELIEDITNHYINAHDLPPLAAKIYAYLLMDCKREGITFEEIIEVFHVSKSSASNSLLFLTQNKFIEQFTKIDQRKRFYKLSSENITMRLYKIHDMLEKEKIITKKMFQYYSENRTEKTESALNKMKIYIEHLDNSVDRLSQTLQLLDNKA